VIDEFGIYVVLFMMLLILCLVCICLLKKEFAVCDGPYFSGPILPHWGKIGPGWGKTGPAGNSYVTRFLIGVQI
jgi:hypothetical protein